jgi:hypothetical protein
MTLEARIGGALALAGAIGRFGFDARPVEVELWEAVTYSGAAFLAIGLVRDVAIKLLRRGTAPRRSGEKLICLESLLGALLVASGLGLLAIDVRRAFHPAVASVAIWGALLLVLSGETKDLVLVLRREKDHANLIPW